MESTSEGKERMDALSKRTLVLLLLLSGLCFYRGFLFISFVFFEFGFCGPFQAQILWDDLATPTHTDNDTQRSKIRSQNLRFGIWNKRGKTNCDATKTTTAVASVTMAKQTRQP